MRRRIAVIVATMSLMMVMLAPAAVADDRVDGFVPDGPSCTGQQVSAHATQDGGFKNAADNHGLTVKGNMLDFVLPDCETGNTP